MLEPDSLHFFLIPGGAESFSIMTQTRSQGSKPQSQAQCIETAFVLFLFTKEKLKEGWKVPES